MDCRPSWSAGTRLQALDGSEGYSQLVDSLFSEGVKASVREVSSPQANAQAAGEALTENESGIGGIIFKPSKAYPQMCP